MDVSGTVIDAETAIMLTADFPLSNLTNNNVMNLDKYVVTRSPDPPHDCTNMTMIPKVSFMCEIYYCLLFINELQRVNNSLFNREIRIFQLQKYPLSKSMTTLFRD